MKITLYVNYFLHGNEDRQRELDECLVRNINNPEIDRIIILGQTEKRFEADKLIWINTDCSMNPHQRPTFRNYFDLVNQHIETPDEISIVANSDIYYDDSLSRLREINLEGTVVCLTRYELRPEPIIEAYDNCQDTWIFQGRVKPLGWIDFPMGIFGCDNRLAWELKHADYKLVNPCRDLKSYHLHPSNIRYNGTCIGGPTENVTRCHWNECGFTPKRTSKTGIIAYSLWGDQAKYNIGAIENAKLIKHIYPGWVARFYVDESVPSDTVNKLRELKADIIVMPPTQGTSGMFWRFLVATEKGIQRWMVRDADSRLNYRERRAVDEWIESGLGFHAMRDHPYHHQLIQGFGFGGVFGLIPNMAELIEAWPSRTNYGNDESFLGSIIWPLVKDNALTHDAFARNYNWKLVPFPTDREYWRYVGERCYHDEHWGHEDRDCLIGIESQKKGNSSENI